jgi:hypothetical protein
MEIQIKAGVMSKDNQGLDVYSEDLY